MQIASINILKLWNEFRFNAYSQFTYVTKSQTQPFKTKSKNIIYERRPRRNILNPNLVLLLIFYFGLLLERIQLEFFINSIANLIIYRSERIIGNVLIHC